MRPRVPLYGRHPAALGTGFVESLSSFVARLCVARSVSVVDVFDFLVRPLVPGGFLNPRGYLSFYLSHDSVALDGVGSRTRHFVAAFEQLTDCPDLHLHTFLPWRLLFHSRSSLVSRSGKRWCPRCFADWRERRLELWEPLLWRVPAVRWCPVHDVPLADRCPACGRVQRAVSQSVPIGYCERCGLDFACAQWSGGSAVCPAEYDTPESWDRWTAIAVFQMLANQAEAAHRASPVGLGALIESARARCPKRSLEALARNVGIARKILDNCRRYQQPPPLRTFLAVCMRLGANPVEVAFAPYRGVPGCGWISAGLSSRPWPRFAVRSRRPSFRRDDPQRWRTIGRALDELLREPRVCAPTHFAKSWQVAPRTVAKRFPERFGELRDRYQTQCDDDRSRVRHRRYQAVRDAVTDLVRAGRDPARSTAFRAAAVYGFDKYDPVLRDVWRDAVRQHGFVSDP